MAILFRLWMFLIPQWQHLARPKKLAAVYVARSDGANKLITGSARELTVPATGTAALIVYGTWAPTLTCGTSGTITMAAAYDTAYYVKIGPLVHIQGLLSVDSVSSPKGTLLWESAVCDCRPVRRRMRDLQASYTIIGNTQDTSYESATPWVTTDRIFSTGTARHGPPRAGRVAANSGFVFSLTYITS